MIIRNIGKLLKDHRLNVQEVGILYIYHTENTVCCNSSHIWLQLCAAEIRHNRS